MLIIIVATAVNQTCEKKIVIFMYGRYTIPLEFDTMYGSHVPENSIVPET